MSIARSPNGRSRFVELKVGELVGEKEETTNALESAEERIRRGCQRCCSRIDYITCGLSFHTYCLGCPNARGLLNTIITC